MKQILLAAVLLLAASPVFAQSSPLGNDPGDPQLWFKQFCPKCGVSAYLDTPKLGNTISRTDLLTGNIQFEGWGFECVSGLPVNRVDVWVETDTLLPDGTFAWQSLKQADGAFKPGSVARPDVAEMYASYCPSVPLNSGFTLKLSNLPDWTFGARRLVLIVWSGVYHTWLVRTYNIVP